ncbi:MAG: phosphatase PAP2 family protein [Gemmatimonadota bacterium]
MATAGARAWSHSLLALVLASPTLGAQAVPVPIDRSRIISPLGAVVGGAALVTAFLIDESWRHTIQDARSPLTDDLASVGNAFGDGRYALPVVGGTWLAGRLLHAPAVERFGRRAGLAYLAGGAATFVLKEAVGRSRPNEGGDASAYHPFSGNASFPSGHTTVVFAMATALADDTPHTWVRVLLYSGATLTGFARMNDDRHWLSDVVAGAIVGVVSVRVLDRVGPQIWFGPDGLRVGVRRSM